MTRFADLLREDLREREKVNQYFFYFFKKVMCSRQFVIMAMRMGLYRVHVDISFFMEYVTYTEG